MNAPRPLPIALRKHAARLLSAGLLTLAAGAVHGVHAQQSTQVWSPRTITNLEDENFYSMDFANADTGYVLGTTGAIYRTVDRAKRGRPCPNPPRRGRTPC